RRILGEHRRRLHLALLQAHAVTILDVDRGDDLHGVWSATECRWSDDCPWMERSYAGAARRAAGLDAPVPGDEVREQLKAGAVALFGMELHGKDISAGNRASKR